MFKMFSKKFSFVKLPFHKRELKDKNDDLIINYKGESRHRMSVNKLDCVASVLETLLADMTLQEYNLNIDKINGVFEYIQSRKKAIENEKNI